MKFIEISTIKKLMLCGASMLLSGISLAEGNLENPAKDAIESGISAISGWHCTASEIEIEVDGKSYGKAGMGTIRTDTESRCGHTNSGFSLLFNYGALPDGEHTLVAKVDGEIWMERTFSTIRPGSDTDFVPDSDHTEYAIDFPKPGDALELKWQSSKQSFTVSRAFRDLINPGKMVATFNRTFFGHARGYDPSRPDRQFGELDVTEFKLNISETAFAMSRVGTILGDCDYNGDITFFFNKVTSQGTFSCSGSSGTYSAEVFVNANEGYYIGRFDMTPTGSEQSTRDFHMALAP
ncbi:hypothetical protein [Pseudoteredinibacter isoporae]|uniref:Uncharacterized protein n=1 Tax=Pseudoteredinibacter isoporae TaxID=570281 RepID=A0A7X0MYN1_9GAMM|nr:hypothetical protein [Pseudoteredinibacter isoporae]MBB6523264.1 hypothetical protein [Pseudoteredinibacter isoporae]NHO88780.1 hypothetical protein [Pseudoteredinibacter isoporae]NIB22529.1 hypothetical protein [Pseudoteredinibacter isoporae]